MQNLQVPEIQELALLTDHEFPFFLPIPQNGDDLETTALKMQRLAHVLSSGHSLSVGPGHVSTPGQKQTAEEFARDRMTSPEMTQWPPMQTFSRRAIAMDIIWRRQGTVPENAAWLTINMSFLAPLVKAVTKIIGAEEHFQKNQRLADHDIAEIKMLKRVNAIAEGNVTRERERLRMLSDSIHKSQALLKKRVNDILEKPTGGS
ncbi:hypothetical protein PENDEC_c002G03493 [Penicillium decumbens]|uniref:Uncharacterized protein n=1 Tax=Penicillium decumbens TaxID=69771 RepID=A0A1V6PM47_PENDC|nr:hypothetical protein PENDEC_c002G03493 [Penicillium decumbens]